jgi:hypothetical protein
MTTKPTPEPEVYYIAMRVAVVNPDRLREMVGDETKPLLHIVRDEIISSLEDVGVDVEITEALDVVVSLTAEVQLGGLTSTCRRCGKFIEHGHDCQPSQTDAKHATGFEGRGLPDGLVARGAARRAQREP